MDTIIIQDLAVSFRVGVPDQERAQPQTLLLTLELKTDFSPAAASDDLRDTIDYFAVAQRLLRFGEGREWRLIEKLASDIAAMVLREFHPREVSVEIKKRILPETDFVAVRLTRRV
jgi:7,8-dihydroneopterin aldolase/epimerase/oxygenase